MGNESNKAKCMQYVEEGIIGAQYTQNGWFVKLKPILSTNKKNTFAYNKPSILFSFVEKGKKGAGFDIYVDIDVFDNWSDDVLGIPEKFRKTIEAERAAGSTYPKAYKYVTGNNGEKSVGFAPASKGFAVINGVTVKDGAKQYANIPVDYDWIRTVCKRYRRIVRVWQAEMAKLTLQNALSYSSNLKNKASDSECNDPVSDDREYKSESITSGKPEPVTENKEVSKPEDKPQKVLQILTVRNTIPLMRLKNNNGFAVKAKDKSGAVYNIIFLNENINRIEPGKWEIFAGKINKGSQLFKACFYKTQNGNYVFEKF